MELINRSPVLIRPKQPYIDWANGFEGAQGLLTLESARSNPTVILVPDFDFPQDAVDYVEANFAPVFEELLGAWAADPGDWPAERTLELFRGWFEIKVHDLVFDMADEPFEVVG